jgi:NAD(P) transhydrogenase subunit alpha
MLIAIPRESCAGETRVAATPKRVEQLIGLGYEVLVVALRMVIMARSGRA